MFKSSENRRRTALDYVRNIYDRDCLSADTAIKEAALVDAWLSGKLTVDISIVTAFDKDGKPRDEVQLYCQLQNTRNTGKKSLVALIIWFFFCTFWLRRKI